MTGVQTCALPISINLANLPGNTLIAQKDSFLCAALGTKVSITFNQKIGAGFFGGEGFILEKLQGDGLAFVHAGGTIIEKQLNNETLRIDTGCVVAFEQTLSYDIQRAGTLKSMIFGGEGIFLPVPFIVAKKMPSPPKIIDFKVPAL